MGFNEFQVEKGGLGKKKKRKWGRWCSWGYPLGLHTRELCYRNTNVSSVTETQIRKVIHDLSVSIGWKK